MKKLLVCFVLITNCVQAKFDAIEFSLSNGLRVVCVKKDSAPIIAFSIWYLCGSQCDMPSKSGCAHYLEHMAFVTNDGKFQNMLDNIGAEKNAFTSLTTVCFHEIIPKNYIEEVFKHESIRMKQLDIEDKAFESERGAILAERNMRIDSDPEGCCDEALSSVLFNRQTGGVPIIGWNDEIQSITKHDLARFHDMYFHPNNAIIVIVGDFENEHIKQLAKRYFGNIKPRVISKRSQTSYKNSVVKEVVYRSSKVGGMASIEYVYNVPFFAKDNGRKFSALQLVILALNLPTSFTNKLLKQVLNKVKGVSFSYSSGHQEYDTVHISIVSSSLEDLEDSIEILKYAVDRFVNSGITEEELASVKKIRSLAKAYEEDDIADVMTVFGFKLTQGFSLDFILHQDYQSITLQECNDVIKEVFSNKPIAISRILPKRM